MACSKGPLPSLKQKSKDNTNNVSGGKMASHLFIVYLCPPKTNASRNSPRNQGCHLTGAKTGGPSHSLMSDSETQNGKH